MINSIQDISDLLVSGFTNWGEYGAVYVKHQDSLSLFGYATKAQYEGRWNFFERVSCGLILNNKTGEVVARGFDKFFNWLEKDTTSSDIRRVYDKVDGSMILVYVHEGKIRCATRGSLDSKQSRWAMEIIDRDFNPMQKQEILRMGTRYTFLFELIHPQDRKVVDYDGESKLILLAMRHKETGEYLEYDTLVLAEVYGFDVVKTVNVDSVEELIEMTKDLKGAEGYVAEFHDNSRFKFKSLEYLRLHKFISDLSPKRVLDAMIADDLPAFLDAVPDEFIDEVTGWIGAINWRLANEMVVARNSYGAIASPDRKGFALGVQECPKWMRPMLFAMYDGASEDDVRMMILKNMMKEI